MDLPSYFLINGYRIYAFGIFLFLGLIFSTFILWFEGKRDGFDEEKIFDMFLLAIFSSVVFSRISYAVLNDFTFSSTYFHVTRFWMPGFELFGAFLGFMAPVFLLSGRWRWSNYRILDIYSLAISFGLSFVALGVVALQKDFSYLFVFSSYLIAFAFLSRFRNRKLKSGVVFSLFLFLNILIGVVFLGDRVQLLFYILLFTIGLANLVYRSRTIMDNNDKTKSGHLFSTLKDKLVGKLKRLEKTRSNLDARDPYLQEGRTVGNSEEMDEALLEDVQKEVVDLQKTFTESALSQVKKALAKMRVGKYGVCEVCGGPIEKARLEAYPEATTCTTCSTKAPQQ